MANKCLELVPNECPHCHTVLGACPCENCRGVLPTPGEVVMCQNCCGVLLVGTDNILSTIVTSGDITSLTDEQLRAYTGMADMAINLMLVRRIQEQVEYQARQYQKAVSFGTDYGGTNEFKH